MADWQNLLNQFPFWIFYIKRITHEAVVIVDRDSCWRRRNCSNFYHEQEKSDCYVDEIAPMSILHHVIMEYNVIWMTQQKLNSLLRLCRHRCAAALSWRAVKALSKSCMQLISSAESRDDPMAKSADAIGLRFPTLNEREREAEDCKTNIAKRGYLDITNLEACTDRPSM